MNYYHFIRSEIKPLLPNKSSRILEVGAGAGKTLSWIKSIYPNAETTGIELNAALRDELQKNADNAIIDDIGNCLPQLSSYDLIILLDVLEHLQDPRGTLRSLTSLLQPGGCVIVSLPNISHLSVSVPLLLQRRFVYQDAGILDRTHRTFFVEDSAIKLLNDANLIVTKGLITGLNGPKSKLVNRLSFGLLRHHLTKQYIMLSELGKTGFVQPRIRWKSE